VCGMKSQSRSSPHGYPSIIASLLLNLPEKRSEQLEPSGICDPGHWYCVTVPCPPSIRATSLPDW
jgi:hypothetical protein